MIATRSYPFKGRLSVGSRSLLSSIRPRRNSAYRAQQTSRRFLKGHGTPRFLRRKSECVNSDFKARIYQL